MQNFQDADIVTSTDFSVETDFLCFMCAVLCEICRYRFSGLGNRIFCLTLHAQNFVLCLQHRLFCAGLSHKHMKYSALAAQNIVIENGSHGAVGFRAAWITANLDAS